MYLVVEYFLSRYWHSYVSVEFGFCAMLMVIHCHSPCIFPLLTGSWTDRKHGEIERENGKGPQPELNKGHCSYLARAVTVWLPGSSYANTVLTVT